MVNKTRKPAAKASPPLAPDDAATIASARLELERQIQASDVRIFDLETKYLDFVADHRGERHLGSLYSGWGRHGPPAVTAAAEDGDDESATEATPPTRRRLSTALNAAATGRKRTRPEELAAEAAAAAGKAAKDGTRPHPAATRLFSMTSTTALASCERQGRKV